MLGADNDVCRRPGNDVWICMQRNTTIDALANSIITGIVPKNG